MVECQIKKKSKCTKVQNNITKTDCGKNTNLSNFGNK